MKMDLWKLTLQKLVASATEGGTELFPNYIFRKRSILRSISTIIQTDDDV